MKRLGFLALTFGFQTESAGIHQGDCKSTLNRSNGSFDSDTACNFVSVQAIAGATWKNLKDPR